MKYYKIKLLSIFLLGSFLIFSACEEKKKSNTIPRVNVSNEGKVMLDSQLSVYQILPWYEGEIRRLSIIPTGGDSVSIENKVIAESHFANRHAYLFSNGFNCIGSMVTDSAGHLQYFQSSILCVDSLAFDESSIRILWKSPNIPLIVFSESFDMRGKTTRIRRMDGITSGELFFDDWVSNEDACGPEEDEGLLPCFSQKSETNLPENGFLPDTLLIHTTGTFLDGKRILPIDRRDTIIPLNDFESKK